MSHLDESVDGEDDELGLSLGVVHEVQVHEFLLLKAAADAEESTIEPHADDWKGDGSLVCLHILEHVRKQCCERHDADD